MNITVMQVSPPVLEVQFTVEEIMEPLMSDAQMAVSSMEITEKVDDTILQAAQSQQAIIATETTMKQIGIEPTPIEPITQPATITITGNIIEGQNPMQTLGQLVDATREIYCGDVNPPEVIGMDIETNEPVYAEKDPTTCPCFQIGTRDEIVENEPETIQEPDINEPEIEDELTEEKGEKT